MKKEFMGHGKSVFEVLKQTIQEFLQDDCPRLAAAMAYYTVFSLPALLFLVVMIAGFAYPGGEAKEAITSEIAAFVGPQTAEQVDAMIEGARERAEGEGGLFVTILGGLVFVFGATGAFAQLQAALNRAWQVAPDPEHAGIKAFIFKRLLSFGMILGTGFLLLVSLVLSAIVSLVGSEIVEVLPAGIGAWVPRTLDFVVSLVMITLLFAAIYRILPDAKIRWREVWVGAFATAILFVIGKFAIGIYLGQSNPGSVYGAAGSLAIVLLWIYLSSILLLLGAEFTQVWASRYGKQIQPSKGAVRMTWTKEGEIERGADAENERNRKGEIERSAEAENERNKEGENERSAEAENERNKKGENERSAEAENERNKEGGEKRKEEGEIERK